MFEKFLKALLRVTIMYICPAQRRQRKGPLLCNLLTHYSFYFAKSWNLMINKYNDMAVGICEYDYVS